MNKCKYLPMDLTGPSFWASCNTLKPCKRRSRPPVGSCRLLGEPLPCLGQEVIWRLTCSKTRSQGPISPNLLVDCLKTLAQVEVSTSFVDLSQVCHRHVACNQKCIPCSRPGILVVNQMSLRLSCPSDAEMLSRTAFPTCSSLRYTRAESICLEENC